LILNTIHKGAALAFIDFGDLTAKDIALKSMQIAADKCVYTNHSWTLNWLPSEIQSDSVDSIKDIKLAVPKKEEILKWRVRERERRFKQNEILKKIQRVETKL